jgi:hypothetical protein
MKRKQVSDKPGLTIISGGQTGVDRGALDAAIALGIPYGGRCPRGRLAEDGRIPSRYRLTESESPLYRVRTEQNVLDTDATLILARGRVTGGTRLTRELARSHGKPCLVVDLAGGGDAGAVRRWLAAQGVSKLNVAGPRESQSPGIADAARQFLLDLLAPRLGPADCAQDTGNEGGAELD